MTPVYLSALSPIFNRAAPPPPPGVIYAAEHNNFPIIFFLRNISNPISSNVGLKSHNPDPWLFFFSKSRPPSQIHTYPPFSISPTSSEVAYVIHPLYPTNTPNRVYLS